MRWWSVLLLLASFATAQDLTIKVKGHLPPVDRPRLFIDQGNFDQVMYVHGSVQRLDFYGFPAGQDFFSNEINGGMRHGSVQVRQPHTVVITHCDTGIIQEIDIEGREYREFQQPEYPAQSQFLKLVDRAKRIGNYDARTVDTGETRDFFGYKARHLITTVRTSKETVHPGARSSYFAERIQAEDDEVIDGWYIEQLLPGCSPEYLRRGLARPLSSLGFPIQIGPSLHGWYGLQAYSPGFWLHSEYPFPISAVTTTEEAGGTFTELQYTGYLAHGLPVEQRATMNTTFPATRKFPPEETQENLWEFTVVDYSNAPIDPAWFEIPSGFRKVKKLYQHQEFLTRSSGH